MGQQIHVFKKNSEVDTGRGTGILNGREQHFKVSELRAVPRDRCRKYEVGVDGEEGDVTRTTKLSEETNIAAKCEVSVWLETCETIRLTINSLRRVENKMLVPYIKLIQTCVRGNLRDLNPSNIVNILHQMLDPGQGVFLS